MPPSSNDRRRHERVSVVQAIFVEIVSRGSRTEAQNTIIRCETADVSVSGLCIHVLEEIPLDAQLNIAVPEEGWIENLELSGVARWVRPDDSGNGYWVGLELENTTRENMEKWFKIVHLLSRRDKS